MCFVYNSMYFPYHGWVVTLFQDFRPGFCDLCELFLLIQDPQIFVFWEEISNFRQEPQISISIYIV